MKQEWRQGLAKSDRLPPLLLVTVAAILAVLYVENLHKILCYLKKQTERHTVCVCIVCVVYININYRGSDV